MAKQNTLGDAGFTLLNRNFILLFFSNLFLFFGTTMAMPVLSFYMDKNGIGGSKIGLVIAALTISSIVMRFVVSPLSNSLGRRTLLLIGLGISLVAVFFHFFTAAFLILFLLRLGHGLGFGLATTMFGTLVADILPKERMGEGMGYFGLGITIAAALGPLLGASLINMPDIRYAFWVAAVLILFSLLLTLWINTDEPKKKDGELFSWDSFVEPRALFPGVMMLFMSLGLSGAMAFIVLFGKEIGVYNVGFFYVIISIFEFVIRPVAGKVFDRKGPHWIVVPGFVVAMIGLYILSISSTVVGMSISAGLFGVGISATLPALQAWAMNSVESDRRVAANATFFNLFDVGTSGGAIILGFIAQHSTYGGTFFYAALIYLFALFIYGLSYIYKFLQSKKN